MCLTPIKAKVKGSGNKYRVVPCGKCPKCLQRRAQSWVIRLQEEEKRHCNSLFITLTYSNESVPITKNGFLTLRKCDFQNFMKRLRFNTGRKGIKYYACGEYGTTTWRPHYHAIIFDVSIEEIDKAWLKGHTYMGDVSGDSIAYTTKYINKGKRIPLHANDDRTPEFSLMSKNLGDNYLTRKMVTWHLDNAADYYLQDGGYEHALPRYYRDRIFAFDEKDILNSVKQIQHAEKLDAAIKQAGSPKEFYRQQFERIRQAKMVYNDKLTKERNKI